MAYRNIINSIALGVLLKNPDMPDYRLMIGTAEQLDSVPLLISQTKIPTKVAETLEKTQRMTNEELEQSIANNSLEVNDFSSNTAILSGTIGGVVR